MTKEAYNFQNRFLIPAIYEFLYEWEDWVELEFDDPKVKEYHFRVIRMLKGAIKPWRTWLQDQKLKVENGE